MAARETAGYAWSAPESDGRQSLTPHRRTSLSCVLSSSAFRSERGTAQICSRGEPAGEETRVLLKEGGRWADVFLADMAFPRHDEDAAH